MGDAGRMRQAFSWLVFPVVVATIIGGSMLALTAGAGASSVVGLATLASLVIIVSLERIRPFEEDWNRSKGDLATDAIYLPAYLGINALIEPFVRVAAGAIGVAVSDSFGFGLWPTAWPLFLQFVLACVVVEAFDYWPHRLLHEVPALWRFHAIHHNPKRLYWLNATRAHPVEVVFRGVVNVIPLALLGAGEHVLVLVAVANTILGLFQHANLDFELGPLSWVFSVGEMHRWHHSLKLEEANHNYGSNFLFWDVVFGTRYRDPERRAPDEIGIEHDDLPASWWGQQSAPFGPR